MIPCLHPPIGLSSPFRRDCGNRQLGLTFHTAALEALTLEETAALEALYELSILPDIRALETGKGAFPEIEVGQLAANADSIPVTVKHEDGSQTQAGVWFPAQWPEIASLLVGGGAKDSPDAEAMLNDLIIAQAHSCLSQDILVTTSPWLLNRRTTRWVREANPHLPSEAARIVGLFLRSRDNYTYMASKGSSAATGHQGFYWVLTRHRLPNMWRYFSACLEAEKVRTDDTSGLAQSVLSRCARALQTRDEIGRRFYMSRPDHTRDEMMYFFDYLGLLLSGAFDAQARIAHRTYSMTKPKERWAGFRHKDFQAALEQQGAKDLHALAIDTEFSAVTTIVAALRNTIHAVSPPGVTVENRNNMSTAFYLTVPHREGSKLWQAAESLGSPEKWGLKRNHIKAMNPFMLEPYTFATILVAQCLAMVDKVAASTEVERLFPEGYSKPKFLESAPEDDLFRKQIRERLAVLG